jgi:hypothetical protein
MNTEQIEFIKSLDKLCVNGTVQSVLMRADLDTLEFDKALAFLLKQTMQEKYALIEQNTKLRKVLVKHNLYGVEVMG